MGMNFSAFTQLEKLKPLDDWKKEVQRLEKRGEKKSG